MDLKNFEMTKENIDNVFDKCFFGAYYKESDKDGEVIPALNLLLPTFRMAEASGLDETTSLRFSCICLQEEVNECQKKLLNSFRK